MYEPMAPLLSELADRMTPEPNGREGDGETRPVLVLKEPAIP